MRRDARADIRYFPADLLQLGAGCPECCRYRGICFTTLLFEVFELVFGLYNLTLPCIILLLGDGTVFKSSIHLVLHGLQLCELFFGFGDCLL